MKYSIIYADPPWRYKDKSCSGGAAHHYDTMKITDICNLRVCDIVNADAVLFMWATYPMLREALRVIDAWGFTYKTIAFQWIKLNPKSQTPFFGLGRWTRGNTEPCLLATRGRPHRISAGVSQLVFSNRREHSQKPDVVRDKIVQLLGPLPRIELFARRNTPGWSVWGNEVTSDVVL